MKNENEKLPLDTFVSFHKLLEHYEEMAKDDNKNVADKAKRILKVANENPILKEGFKDLAMLETYKEEIDYLLHDIFTPVLTKNEIKVAATPTMEKVFTVSARFKNIVKDAGESFILKKREQHHKLEFIHSCCLILQVVYGITVDFVRPMYFDIPDKKGIIKHYRVMYNGDFIEIAPTDKAVTITDEIVKELLENIDNETLWRTYFPEGSYTCKGFLMANMFDVTIDNAISEVKTNLLSLDKGKLDFHLNFLEIFKSMFAVQDLKLGFSIYNEEEETLECVTDGKVNSLIVNNSPLMCKQSCQEKWYHNIIENRNYYAIANLDHALEQKPNSKIFQSLKAQGVQSIILAPIAHEGRLLGVLELGSPRPFELHQINARKLDEIIPYFVVTILRTINEERNLIEAIIQQECTSIHSSVYWKFEKEAKRFIKESRNGNRPSFNEVVFNDVHPLYGQIDIKESSVARNESTRKDLLIQLNLLNNIFDAVAKEESLPIYDEIKFRIKTFLNDIRKEYQSNSEQVIVDFLQEEINPVLDHLERSNQSLATKVKDYKSSLYENGIVYKYRKDYDDSITVINKRMATILDEKQEEAQKMFPHFFERYKTDGVEHTMYIGQSITRNKKYNNLYLSNLRLWQLQVMCDMENEFYQLQPDIPHKLKVASLILVHSATLSVRFRMDEHKFDVDGTYNARYEVIKKRLDKAHIAGTNERITQEGKIAIVYTTKKDEQEYMRYIKLLQVQKYISDEVEKYELESLQGVSGLKAIRVQVLYTSKDEINKYYTLDELPEMKKIKTI